MREADARRWAIALLAFGVACLVLGGVLGSPWPFGMEGPAWLGGFFALAGLAAIGVAWLLRPKPKPSGSRRRPGSTRPPP